MLLSDCEDLAVERGETLVRVERVVGGLRAIAGKAFGSRLYKGSAACLWESY